MATKAKIDQNNKKIKLVAETRVRRDELRNTWKNETLPYETRLEAYKKLCRMPRNSSATRVRNRCAITGRPRAFLRKFGLSRLSFRQLASRGLIPGVIKSSW